MRTITWTLVILLSVAVLFFARPANVVALPEKDVPKQAAFAHMLRFKVLEVTPVEKTATHNLLKLRVKPWYGKISQHYYDLHRTHDTQELTILFPAALDAAIQAGDIIDYRIAGYLVN